MSTECGSPGLGSDPDRLAVKVPVPSHALSQSWEQKIGRTKHPPADCWGGHLRIPQAFSSPLSIRGQELGRRPGRAPQGHRTLDPHPPTLPTRHWHCRKKSLQPGMDRWTDGCTDGLKQSPHLT